MKGKNARLIILTFYIRSYFCFFICDHVVWTISISYLVPIHYFATSSLARSLVLVHKDVKNVYLLFLKHGDDIGRRRRQCFWRHHIIP